MAKWFAKLIGVCVVNRNADLATTGLVLTRVRAVSEWILKGRTE